MSKKKKEDIREELTEEVVENQRQEEIEVEAPEEAINAPEMSDLEKAEIAATEAKDKYLRLYSEFENFRRRTAKEKTDLIATASRSVIENLLPVMDDFERAMLSAQDEKASVDSVKEGLELIQQKFRKALEAKGLRKMNTRKGDKFDDELHEAIAQIPADKELEGKIVDVVEPGYLLGDTVIRFAKVVTGAKQ